MEKLKKENSKKIKHIVKKREDYLLLSSVRLYLRELRLSDVNDNYYRWMNDPEVTQYLESRFNTHSKESLHEYVKGKLSNTNEIFLAIMNKEEDRHIGNIKLGPINWRHHYASIGILIGEKQF